MDPLVLTHISEMTDIRTGNTQYYLVFNEGELHTPVPKESLQMVLATYFAKVPDGSVSLVNGVPIQEEAPNLEVTDNEDMDEQF